MGGSQDPAAWRGPAFAGSPVLTRTLRRPDCRQKCVSWVLILGDNVQISDSAAAARVVMNEIASCRGRGETRPHPKVGHAALLTLSRTQSSAASFRSDPEWRDVRPIA